MNKKNFDRILIVRLSSLGDILLTTPVVKAVKKRFPDSIIDFAIGSQFKEIYQYNPSINAIFCYDKTLGYRNNAKLFNKFTNQIGFDKYDLVIDLQNNLRSYLLLYGKYKSIVRAKKNRLHKLSLVYFKKSLTYYNSVVYLYAECLRKLGIYVNDELSEFWLPEEAGLKTYIPEIRDTEQNGAFIISIAPGSKHFTKMWFTDYYIELSRKLIETYNCEIFLLGSKDDLEICTKIFKELNLKAKNYAGTTSLFEAGRKLDKSRLLICNDSGLMHLANARKVPIVAIFGSTVKEFGFHPLGGNYSIIEKDLHCRPCTHIGRDSCPKGHFKCMKEISVEEVYDAVKNMIDKKLALNNSIKN